MVARYAVLGPSGVCQAIVAYHIPSYMQIFSMCSTQSVSLFVSAGPQPYSVYWVSGLGSVQLYSLPNNSTIDSFAVGQYPLIPNPSAIATHGGRLIHIATSGPMGFVTVNSAGQQIGEAVVLDQTILDATCRYGVWQSVAVDDRANVWLPICNGTIVVFNAGHELIRTIVLPSTSVPFAVSPSLTAESCYVIDAVNPLNITEFNSSSGEVIRVFGSGELAGFWDVSVAADDTIWATNYQPAYIYRFAPNGTVLSFWNMTAYQPNSINILLHIAPDVPHNQVLVSHQLLMERSLPQNHLLWLDTETGATIKQFTIDPMAGFNANVGLPRNGSHVYVASMTTNTTYVFDQQQTQQKHRHSRQRLGGVTKH